jgi:hypothetical protein
MFLVGCGGGLYPPPPRTIAQVEGDRTRHGGGYPRRTVVLYNLQRAVDDRQSSNARLESIKVVERYAPQEPWVLDRLAEVLDDEKAPEPVRTAVLKVLLDQDYPGLAGRVVDLLPSLPTDSRIRRRILGWLDRNAGADALAEVVQLWALEAPDSDADARFRQVAEQVTRLPWEEALLRGLNSPSFPAKGSALEVLRGRINASQLRDRFGAMEARTPAVRAIQAFTEAVDYLPSTAEQLVTIVQFNTNQAGALSDVERLYRKWRRDSGYVFQVHDFHVLAQLARDPLRKDFRREQLLLALGQTLRGRKHVDYRGDKRGRQVEANFWDEAEELTKADLWRLYLLDEMLSNANVQAALRVTARRDRSDTRTSWGGLVRYVSGRAQAYYYRPAVEAAGNDLVYVPTSRAFRDARDSLCWFFAHFEEVSNADRAGPDADELASMRQRGQSALLLTSLDEARFSAHWYNDAGVVVSLGVFPFGR